MLNIISCTITAPTTPAMHLAVTVNYFSLHAGGGGNGQASFRLHLAHLALAVVLLMQLLMVHYVTAWRLSTGGGYSLKVLKRWRWFSYRWSYWFNWSYI